MPVLVLVELSEAIRRGTVRCEAGFSRWSAEFLASGGFIAADLTRDAVFEAERLYGISERGDRLIAATAAALGCPLITSDSQIARHAGVTTIWSLRFARTVASFFSAPGESKKALAASEESPPRRVERMVARAASHVAHACDGTGIHPMANGVATGEARAGP